MLVVVTVVFLLIHLIPGDPVAVILGPDATPSQIEATRAQLGLDRPLYEQLGAFYVRVLRGDLGRSYFLNRPVTQALWERAEPTSLLTLSALLVAIAIGVPSGLIAGASPGSAWDRVLMLAALFGVCIPGLGRLIISAILRRDYPVVQGVVLVTAAAYVLVNLVVDVLYVLIDPRIRYD